MDSLPATSKRARGISERKVRPVSSTAPPRQKFNTPPFPSLTMPSPPQKQRDLWKEFRAFLDSKQPDDLTRYLLLPLQRVPQYLTMLVNLLGVTKETDPDYEKLKEVCIVSRSPA